MTLLTLPEARAALRWEDTNVDQDTLLMDYVSAITAAVEKKVGWVAQRTKVIEIRQGGCEAALPGANIISLVSGEYIQSGEPVDVAGMYVGIGGILRRSDMGNLPLNPWRLTCVVGMASVPPNIKTGAVEILRESWNPNEGSSGEPPKPYLIAYRVDDFFAGDAELLGFS